MNGVPTISHADSRRKSTIFPSPPRAEQSRGERDRPFSYFHNTDLQRLIRALGIETANPIKAFR